MITKTLPELASFLGSYLDQDWPSEFPDETVAIRTGLNEWPEENILQALEELRWLIDQRFDEQQLAQVLLRDLSCYFYPPGVGKTCQTWLEEAHSQIAQFLGHEADILKEGASVQIEDKYYKDSVQGDAMPDEVEDVSPASPLPQTRVDKSHTGLFIAVALIVVAGAVYVSQQFRHPANADIQSANTPSAAAALPSPTPEAASVVLEPTPAPVQWPILLEGLQPIHNDFSFKEQTRTLNQEFAPLGFNEFNDFDPLHLPVDGIGQKYYRLSAWSDQEFILTYAGYAQAMVTQSWIVNTKAKWSAERNQYQLIWHFVCSDKNKHMPTKTEDSEIPILLEDNGAYWARAVGASATVHYYLEIYECKAQ